MLADSHGKRSANSFKRTETSNNPFDKHLRLAEGCESSQRGHCPSVYKGSTTPSNKGVLNEAWGTDYSSDTFEGSMLQGGDCFVETPKVSLPVSVEAAGIRIRDFFFFLRNGP